MCPYDFPKNDHNLEIRSEMLENLLVSLQLKGSMRQITDLAFDSIDVDGSGGLD
jgi:hypothetical protein